MNKKLIKEIDEIPNQDNLDARIIEGLHKSGHISAELMQLMIDLFCGYPDGHITPSYFLGVASKLCNKPVEGV